MKKELEWRHEKLNLGTIKLFIMTGLLVFLYDLCSAHYTASLYDSLFILFFVILFVKRMK